MIAETPVENPFPGLRPFEPYQADIFFGRDEQIEELTQRLQKRRFIAVVGTSGSGKSSLVRAGLIPVLERSQVGFLGSNWRIVILRPGRNANEELASVLSASFGDPEQTVLDALQASSAGLAKYARQRLAPQETLLILVDQFEELFRYSGNMKTSGQGSAAFVKLLLAATGHNDHPLPGLDEVPVYVVITMRSDFIGRCSQFRGLPEVLNDTQYLVPRMTREEQREATEGPVGMAGARIASPLVQRLLNEVSDNPDQLPVLQHVLMRIWENSRDARAHGKSIDVKDYDAVGGMSEALNRDADSALAALPDEQSKTIARRLFQKLVEPGAPDEETRQPTPLSQIVGVIGGDEAQVRKVTEIFRGRGFLTLSGDDDPIVDISHESLIRNWKQLGEWVQQESRSAATYRRLADAADLYVKGEANLLQDPQLQLTLNWLEETHPNEAWARRYHPKFAEAMRFLDDSRKAHEREKKLIERQRERNLKRALWTAVLFGGLFLLAAIAFVVAIYQWEKAKQERVKGRHLLYEANVYAAHRAFGDDQFSQAELLLSDLLDPNLKELRGFEWFHLWRMLHGNDASLSGHSASVSWVAFSRHGNILASGSKDKTIKLWDTNSYKELATLTGHSADVSVVRFSRDDTILASGSLDGTVKLWDTTSRKELATLPHSDSVRGLAFSPNGQILATCGDNEIIKLWEISSRKELATLSGHTGSVSWVAFSPDSRTLASSSEDQSVKLWDVASGGNVATLESHTGPVWMVTFSPDGKTLATSSDDYTVKIWDVPSRKLRETLEKHKAPVWVVLFSSDGQTLVTGSLDNTVRIWDTTSFKELMILIQPAPVRTLALSPDGKTIATGSTDSDVKLWKPTSPRTLAKLEDAGRITSIAFSPDDRLIATGAYDNTIKLWDTSSRTQLATLKNHSGAVNTVAFSPDGKTLASGSADKTVKLWDLNSREELVTLTGHLSVVLTVAFSPDGKLLASGGSDRTVRLWDTVSQKELGKLVQSGRCAERRNAQPASVLFDISKEPDDISKEPDCAIRAIAFSPDGNTLATGNGDSTVKLWDIRNTASLKELDSFMHSDAVSSVAFSRTGKLLAAGGLDGKVKLWDTASRREVTTPTLPLSHEDDVTCLAFTPDEKTLASGSLDKTVKLWDTVLPKELATFKDRQEAIYAVAFSHDGKILASGSSDGTVVLLFAASEDEVKGR